MAVNKVPFHIKICGVKTAEVIRAVALSGGDAVGLNCFAASKRYVGIDQGRELSQLAQSLGVLPIGLFVNASLDSIQEIKESWGLNHVQLHGDETIEFVSAVQNFGLHVIRAIRLPTGILDASLIEQRVSVWEQLGCSILLDADVGGAFGGAGEKLDWRSINVWRQMRVDEDRAAQFILAGGLDAEMLSAAVSACQPAGVDVASGVELAKGVKDKSLVDQFCRLAKKCLDELR